ncbi:UDP-glucose 4-epimerase [Thermoflexales bacterium]|nr:UDP-glucose 4-epimerase [Thermoflexales bacterium]
MTEQRVVLVDGVAGYWGGRVAERLLTEPDLHIIGLDTAPPQQSSGIDFIQADIRNPLLVELLKEEKVHTYVHLAFRENERPTETAFEFNVMGTLKVLSACAQADVQRVILKSSTLIYGAAPGNSAFLREDHPLNAKRNFGTLRDLIEIENFCVGFRSQAPEVRLTLLRFANIIGPTVDSPLTRFLRDDTAPLLLGYDPVIQIIHEEDAVKALAHAAIYDVPGVYNVAAPGAMPLLKLTGLAGKLPVPVFHPLAYLGEALLGSRFTAFDFDYFRYPCVGDLQRMREDLEFTPTHLAEDAVREFAALRKHKAAAVDMTPQEVEEEHLRAIIERRQNIRRQLAQAGPSRPQPRGRLEAEVIAESADSNLYEEES